MSFRCHEMELKSIAKSAKNKLNTFLNNSGILKFNFFPYSAPNPPNPSPLLACF